MTFAKYQLRTTLALLQRQQSEIETMLSKDIEQQRLQKEMLEAAKIIMTILNTVWNQPETPL